MANRIVGNTIIVDSAMGNAFILSSANMPVMLNTLKVNSIEFWSADTTAACVITGQDTTNVLKRFSWLANGAGAGFAEATQMTSFGNTQEFHYLKIPTLTAGTAWIHLA